MAIDVGEIGERGLQAQRPAARRRVDDESAAPLLRGQQAFARQHLHRLARRDPRHFELAGEVQQRRQLVARLELALRDAPSQQVCKLHVTRNRAVAEESVHAGVVPKVPFIVPLLR